MKKPILIFVGLMFVLLCLLSSQALGDTSGKEKISRDQLVEFARCLTEKGWVMYSSFTCSACRAQIELFDRAADQLKIIECNPHAPDTQVQRCLEKKIRYTPTWLMEKNGSEVERFKGYKKLEDLASLTGCDL
jgi:hypothetical protein